MSSTQHRKRSRKLHTTMMLFTSFPPWPVCSDWWVACIKFLRMSILGTHNLSLIIVKSSNHKFTLPFCRKCDLIVGQVRLTFLFYDWAIIYRCYSTFLPLRKHALLPLRVFPGTLIFLESWPLIMALCSLLHGEIYFGDLNFPKPRPVTHAFHFLTFFWQWIFCLDDLYSSVVIYSCFFWGEFIDILASYWITDIFSFLFSI